MSEPKMNGVACPQCQGFTTLDHVPCVECVSRMKASGAELAKAALSLELQNLRDENQRLQERLVVVEGQRDGLVKLADAITCEWTKFDGCHLSGNILTWAEFKEFEAVGAILQAIAQEPKIL